MSYKTLTDDELIGLLATEEDRLPRKAVDECILRADRLTGPLGDIVSKVELWEQGVPYCWEPVHATYILGAIGTKETVVPLLKALRLASAHDCEWVSEELPSIFRTVGIDAFEGLMAIASDQTTDWYTRAVAMDSLAAITISGPKLEKQIFEFMAALLEDDGEERDVRQTAANVLLDFGRQEFRDLLIQFGKEERALRDRDRNYAVSFDDEEVDEWLYGANRGLRHYTGDWLSFYNPDEIDDRQKRWDEEEQFWEEEERARAEFYVRAEPFVLATPTVGRNDLCPCGSEKKYKKCCGMTH